MKQNKRKTAFVPCKSFKHDGVNLTVGVSEVTINSRPVPSEGIPYRRLRERRGHTRSGCYLHSG